MTSHTELKRAEKKQKVCLEDIKYLKKESVIALPRSCRVDFIKSTLLKSPRKAFNRISTISTFE